MCAADTAQKALGALSFASRMTTLVQKALGALAAAEQDILAALG
jgi:hypothetical protein